MSFCVSVKCRPNNFSAAMASSRVMGLLVLFWARKPVAGNRLRSATKIFRRRIIGTLGQSHRKIATGIFSVSIPKGSWCNGRAFMKTRCAWARNELSIRYHDEEWGVPVHDDRTLFEFLILEGAQAGLSWETILNKREHYRTAFDGFDPSLVVRYDQRKIRQLLRNPGIVRDWLNMVSAGH